MFIIQDDVTYAGYERHLTSQRAPAPLTSAEEELEQIKRTEVSYNHPLLYIH